MKNLRKILTIAVIAILASCTKEGPVGPAGTNGTNGNANVTAYSFKNGGSGWTSVSEIPLDFTATNLATYVSNGGVVQVYLRRSTATTDWVWVPGYYMTGVVTKVFINDNILKIYFQDLSANVVTESTPEIMVILIPATTKINGRMSSQKLTFDETMKLYNPKIISVN